METIFAFNQMRVFSLGEARALLPVIYRITEAAQFQVKSLINRLEAIKSTNPQAAEELESLIDQEVRRWEKKIEKLGAKPKGLWLADFDNGTGYYCWRFPETQISFSHGYSDGYSGRKLIEGASDESCSRTNQHSVRPFSEEFPEGH